MRMKTFFLGILLLFLIGCKQKTNNQNRFLTDENTLIGIDTLISKEDFSKNEIDTILRKEQNEQVWVEIDKIEDSFKKIEGGWKRFVKIKGNDRAEIELMELVEYELDSIQNSEKFTILYIKGADWIYKFNWIDEERHIGKWEYIYNQTKIDANFSMYVIDKRFEYLLD